MAIGGAGFGSGQRPMAYLPAIASPSLVPDLVAGLCLHAPSSRIRPMPRPTPAPTILVFDSGLGGLSVYREVARARPDARFVYAADDAMFPYGRIEEGRLAKHIVGLMEALIAAHHPDLVVIACATASTIALPTLRARFAVRFVGTVPAIKPACAASSTRRVSVLGTEGTVQREYTRALIREFAGGCKVTLVGSPRLASLVESKFNGEPVEDAAVAAEIAPCFVDDGGARTDTVVLACTHYPLLRDDILRLSPWTVALIDPAPAIARRVVELIGPPQHAVPPAPARAVFTSGRAASPFVAAALSRHQQIEHVPIRLKRNMR
jgi:glutamate racemase